MIYNFDLIDCLDEIIPENDTKYLSEDDELELYDMCIYLMSELIENNPTLITDPNFNELFEENIHELVHSHFMDSVYYTEDAEEEIDELIEYSKTDFFKYIIPPRSYPSTLILQLPNIEKMSQQIDILRNKHQPTQRTKEWYMNRYNLITASNAYKIFESQSTQNQLIYEKCKPLVEEEYGKFVNVNSPLHWGQKYEPVSVMIYEKNFKTKVEDFGCITHDEYSFLGASPDGINIDVTNERYGRMLEIKNIVNREIDGIPKKEYWIQMQLQMEVCNLDECDFLETKFVEYEDYETFSQDSIKDIDTNGEEFINLCESIDGKMKGIIIYFHKENNSPYYVYMPFDIYDEIDINEWIDEELKKYENIHTYIKTIYWKLEKHSCVLVCRNKWWFKSCIDEFEKFWKLIESERISGHEHRQPNKRIQSVDKNKIIVSKLDESENNNVLQRPESSTQNLSILKSSNLTSNLNSKPLSLNLQFKNNIGQSKCLLKIIKK